MKYRFFYIKAMGEKWYMKSRGVFYLDRKAATLYTDADWQDWGQEYSNLEREEVGEDELMRQAGAPTLPGFEL